MTTATLEWAPLWDAMKTTPEAWIPTTKAMYWEMLEVLPPRKIMGANFLVGEADHHNADGRAVYACFCKFGDSYCARYLTVDEFMREHGHTPARELH